MDGVPTSASLFDFGLYFFHNAHQTLQIGIGPYFYLPKMESHLEARYAAQDAHGTQARALTEGSTGGRAGMLAASGTTSSTRRSTSSACRAVMRCAPHPIPAARH